MVTRKIDTVTKAEGAKASPKPDRRAEAIGAAIEVLAHQGARGLTHREIDRVLDWPVGTTSNYFRRRNDIFVAIAERIMELDLADLATLEIGCSDSEGMTVDHLTERFVGLLKLWMKANHRSRLFARAEILFESTRNAELRKATQNQISLVNALTYRMFVALGSRSPGTAAEMFGLMITGLHISILIAKKKPNSRQLQELVHSWISICAGQLETTITESDRLSDTSALDGIR